MKLSSTWAFKCGFILQQNKLNLKQFIVRSEVIKLYRELLKTSRQVNNKEYCDELQQWIKDDFRKNQNITDPSTINMYITYGRKCLKELETNINLAK